MTSFGLIVRVSLRYLLNFRQAFTVLGFLFMFPYIQNRTKNIIYVNLNLEILQRNITKPKDPTLTS